MARMGGYNKWPRDYAAEIIEMKTVEQRRAALATVPEPLRDWVKDYVVSYFEIRKHMKWRR